MEKTDVENIMHEMEEGKAVLLDVRSVPEYTESHAVHSMNFDVARIEAGELPEIAKDMKIYTYCRAGGRAEKTRQALEAKGFTGVKSIGGLSNWIDAGGAVEKATV